MLEDIKEIVKIQLNGLEKLLDNQKIKINISDDVIDYIARNGYNPQFGARPIKRLIQKGIVNELSKQIIAGNILKENEIKVQIVDNQIKFLNK